MLPFIAFACAESPPLCGRVLGCISWYVASVLLRPLPIIWATLSCSMASCATAPHSWHPRHHTRDAISRTSRECLRQRYPYPFLACLCFPCVSGTLHATVYSLPRQALTGHGTFHSHCTECRMLTATGASASAGHPTLVKSSPLALPLGHDPPPPPPNTSSAPLTLSRVTASVGNCATTTLAERDIATRERNLS
ncbi:hypothetical protein C8R43DRAFT_523510 [Mycena crocata]|nr:hypothetical protein C8R43DRAFT_523510 [Mycena crocata]